MNPEYPGTNPETPGITPENPDTNPENSGIPDPQSEDPQLSLLVLNTTDEELLDAAADLPLRVKGRSRFDRLTAQEQAAIIGLLQIHTSRVVLKLIAQPPPIGFSLKVGQSALYEFRARYKKREADRFNQHITGCALAMIKASENPIEDFPYIYERMLQAKALVAANDQDESLERIELLTNTLAKLRKQALAERKQDHAEQVQKQKFAPGQKPA